MVLYATAVAQKVIGKAIQVHRELGPGLFESVYERCLAHELTADGIEFERQVALPVVYREISFSCAYRADFIVERQLLVELKCVERIHPVHEAQVLTYLRLARVRQGLLINFNTRWLRDGLKSYLWT